MLGVVLRFVVVPSCGICLWEKVEPKFDSILSAPMSERVWRGLVVFIDG